MKVLFATSDELFWRSLDVALLRDVWGFYSLRSLRSKAFKDLNRKDH